MKPQSNNRPPFDQGEDNEQSGMAVESEIVASGRMQIELERSAIDAQVATAKQYPRILSKVLADMETAVTSSSEIAEGCFYALKRKNKDGTDAIIEGPSIRLAEIVSSCWGNMRTGSRVVEIGDKFVKVQGAAFDLEKNVATTSEVMRRITGKGGYRYNDDLIVLTLNAAMSIAKRNAVMGVVPRVYIMNLMKKAQTVAAGNQMTLPAKRDGWLKWWGAKGVPVHAVLGWLGVQGADDIQTEHIRLLAGLRTSLEEGDTTIEKEFSDYMVKPAPERPGKPQEAEKLAPAQAKAPESPVSAPPQGQGAVFKLDAGESGGNTAAQPIKPAEANSVQRLNVWDSIRGKMTDSGLAINDFLGWLKENKFLTEAQGLEDVSQVNARRILANWDETVANVARWVSKAK